MKIIFYCLPILLSLNAVILSMKRDDLSGGHSKVLIEDLANITDADLEFKDSDQLELLLSEIDDSMQDPQNDFDGEFNAPEITDDVNDNYQQLNSKISHLKTLKQDIETLLRSRDLELGPRN